LSQLTTHICIKSHRDYQVAIVSQKTDNWFPTTERMSVRSGASETK